MSTRKALTIPVPIAAELLGISRSSAYAAIKEGSFPVRVIKIKDSYRVPTADLLKTLGQDTLPEEMAA